jgi:large subunit ribosomal protein L24
VSVNLSKNLREKHKKRNVPVRKADSVKVMRGKFKGKQGKVERVSLQESKIYIEGIQMKKKDGSKINVPLRPSNLQITELISGDRKRFKTGTETKEKKQEKSEKTTKKTEVKKKTVKKSESNKSTKKKE